MASTTTLSIPSRSLSWRAVLVPLAVLVIAVSFFVLTVGFGSDTSTKSGPSAVTHTTLDQDMARCHAGRPC